MTGLINQARTQLRQIVNELAMAEKDQHRPRLEISPYEYGRPSLGAESGFIRQIVPLTDHLDRVSETLFALTTSGGDEYAGQVIQLVFHCRCSDIRAQSVLRDDLTLYYSAPVDSWSARVPAIRAVSWLCSAGS